MLDKPEAEDRKQPRWIVPTITTVVGILFSILVAWYQINLNEEQALEAEKERAKAVQNELVQIVEEHIINEKPLDVSRLARLSEFRAKQEHLLVIPTVSDVVENAEFNILKSQYLEFSKKQQFKDIFDGIYAEVTIPPEIQYAGLYKNTVNDIYASIKNGSTKDLSSKINKLVGDFNATISELEARSSVRERFSVIELFNAFITDPKILIISIGFYILLMYILLFMRRKSLRRKYFEKEMQREIYDDYVRERAEFMKAATKDRANQSEDEIPNNSDNKDASR